MLVEGVYNQMIIEVDAWLKSIQVKVNFKIIRLYRSSEAKEEA